jgi:UDP-N-acetylglucosamine/UDP-N-acetylgalactosamine diphosphorylase
VAYLDPAGRRTEPQQPNAIKFERFIFDLIPWAHNAIVVEVDPAEGFAPLKNASGAQRDTPETVKAQMVALHRQWLRRAGAEVAEGVDVELSPLWALDADELAAKIPPGTRVTEPTYFH